MAKGVNHLGIGLGLIYATAPDGVSVIQNIANDGSGERYAKSLASVSFSESRNKIATGSVEFTASVGGETVTALNVDGVNQIASGVATSATTDATASDVVNAVNAFTPASGPDYTAYLSGSTVVLFADEESGSDVNGVVVTLVSTNPVTIVVTETDMAGGANFSEIYDEFSGYRFFLDANYGTGTFPGDGVALPGDLTNAIEISDELIPQTFSGALRSESVVISGGELAFTRKSLNTEVIVDTESAAASDDLDSIDAQTFAIGDRLIIKGLVVGQVTTVKDGTGNINLRTGDFVTGERDSVLILQLNRATPSSAPEWFEVSRSTQMVPLAADFRTNGFAFGNEGVGAISATTGSTETLTVVTDEVYQIVTGATTLASNFEVALDTTGALAGDTFIVEYNATITASGNSVIIGGITLTDNQALTGGYTVVGYYDGAAWQTYLVINLEGSPEIETAQIQDGAITVEKLEADLKVEDRDVPASFETDEQGDVKIKWFYPGTVTEITAYVTKLVEASDDGQLCVKNDAAVTVDTLDFSGGAVIGTGVTETPTANNTFVAGDVWTFNTLKPTPGGKILISVKVVRS
jgi:hypothetical protein